MSEDGKSQEMPPGFHVVVLPFRDDIRAPPKNMTGSADVGQSSLIDPGPETVLMCQGRISRFS